MLVTDDWRVIRRVKHIENFEFGLNIYTLIKYCENILVLNITVHITCILFVMLYLCFLTSLTFVSDFLIFYSPWERKRYFSLCNFHAYFILFKNHR